MTPSHQHLDAKLISWNHRFSEAGVLNPHEKDQLILAFRKSLKYQHTPHLGH
jgi:hypothetical protein